MNIEKLLGKALLEGLMGDSDGDSKKLTVDQQKDLLSKYISEAPLYVNPFSVGDSIISHPDKPKYKFPNQDRPGVVLGHITGKDCWIEKNGRCTFVDTFIACVDEDDGEILFYKVDSNYLIKA